MSASVKRRRGGGCGSYDLSGFILGRENAWLKAGDAPRQRCKAKETNNGLRDASQGISLREDRTRW